MEIMVGVASRRVRKLKTTGPRALAEVLIAKHKKLGIPTVGQPNFKKHGFPELPEDISTLHGHDLSALYGRFDAFASYVSSKLAEAEVSSLEAAKNLKDAETKLGLDALKNTQKGQVTVKKMEVYLEKEVRELRSRDLYHKAEVKLLKSRLEGLERSIRTLSREQSRREKIDERRKV